MARSLFLINGRLFSLFIILAVTALIIAFLLLQLFDLFSPVGTSFKVKSRCLLDPQYGYNVTEQALTRVCKVAKQNGLSSLIWSHRGHWKGGKADGSFAAVERLLQNEIYHFDVDVSIATTVNEGANERRDGQWDANQLIVAHPSALLAEQNQTSPFSTLSSLLWQLSQSKIVSRQKLLDEVEGRHSTILLTVEPKFPFADHFSLDSLVWTVRNSSISQHVAVIVNSPEMLNLLLNTARSLQPVDHQHLSPLNVAVAFRSQPKSVHDYQWTRQVSSRIGRWKSIASVHTAGVELNIP